MESEGPRAPGEAGIMASMQRGFFPKLPHVFLANLGCLKTRLSSSLLAWAFLVNQKQECRLSATEPESLPSLFKNAKAVLKSV